MSLSVILDNLVFPECPRWRDGTLWLSDCHDGRVLQIDNAGTMLDSFEVPGGPAGLGWLPDGDALIVSINNLCIYRRRPDGTLEQHADLSDHHRYHANDMIVDASGHAYVGEVGIRPGEAPRSTVLLLVSPDGSVRVAADDMRTPNGAAISGDGKTLIVAESMACRLLVFAIGENGTLSDRRVFAQMDQDGLPDGICLDAEGCVWIAAPRSHAVLRISPVDGVVKTVSTGKKKPYACVLGGPDRLDLLICVADTHEVDEARRLRGGQIVVAKVAVPGSGRP